MRICALGRRTGSPVAEDALYRTEDAKQIDRQSSTRQGHIVVQRSGKTPVPSGKCSSHRPSLSSVAAASIASARRGSKAPHARFARAADLFCKPNACISAAGKRSSATPEHVQRALRLRAPIAMRGNIHGSERVGFSSHIHGGRFEVKCKLAEIIGVQRTTPHSKAESSRIELIPAASAMRLCCVPDKLQLSSVAG